MEGARNGGEGEGVSGLLKPASLLLVTLFEEHRERLQS